MLFVVYMSHVHLDKIGEDLKVDDVLRDVERRKSEASVARSVAAAPASDPSPATAIPTVAAPAEQFASSLSSPPSPRASASSRAPSSTSLQAGLQSLAVQGKAPAQDPDDEFHDVDEEFYDAES